MTTLLEIREFILWNYMLKMSHYVTIGFYYKHLK